MSYFLWVIGLAVFLGGRWLASRLLGIRARRIFPWPSPSEAGLARRAVVALAGSASCWAFAVAVLFAIYAIAGVPGEGKTGVVGAVIAGKPAERAGLRAGDEITAVDGHAIDSYERIAPLVNETAGRLFPVEIVRDGERRTVQVQAEPSGGAFRIGVQVDANFEPRPAPAGVALGHALRFPVGYARLTLRQWSEIVRGRVKADFSGPVGVMQRAPRRRLGIDLGYLIAIESLYVAAVGLPVALLLLVGRRRVPT